MLNVKEDNTKTQPNIKCPQCMLQIQGIAVNIWFDSVFHTQSFQMNYTKICSQTSNFVTVTLLRGGGGYGGTHKIIDMRGYFQATVQYKSRKTVSMHGATILRWPAQAKLHIIVNPAQIQPVLHIHYTPDDECNAQIQAATRGVISQSELTTATRNDTNIQMAMKYMTSKWPRRKKLSGNLPTPLRRSRRTANKRWHATQRRQNRHSRRTTIT